MAPFFASSSIGHSKRDGSMLTWRSCFLGCVCQISNIQSLVSKHYSNFNFNKNKCSLVQSLLELRSFYDKRSASSKWSLQQLVAKFKTTGSINSQSTLLLQRNARLAKNFVVDCEIEENQKQSIPGLSPTSI